MVAPNTIDWNFVFSNADFFKNPTLYVTEIVIVLIYIIAMIWARRKDRQDLQQVRCFLPFCNRMSTVKYLNKLSGTLCGRELVRISQVT